MKKILLGTAAVVAMVTAASPAAAQTSERQYAAPLPGGGSVTLNNPSDVNPTFGPFILPSAQDTADLLVETFQIGTRYSAEASAPADSEVATPVVNVAFSLSGTVNQDCSFFAGNNDAARQIDFGVIGVRTGDNENVNQAFEMVGPATAEIESLTAGCNFNNEVEIVKDNVDGMVNAAAGGYDTDEFQANIPYSVTASWTGVPLNAVTNGSAQSLNVDTDTLSGTLQQGAWRSSMGIDIVAPAISDRGLVAGSYEGTTTLTLRAL